MAAALARTPDRFLLPCLTRTSGQRMFRRGMSSAPSATDDLALLRSAAAGDSAAMLALYDRHAPALLALAFRVLGNRDEAEEVLQESFVKIWQEAAAFDPARAGFRAWSCTIVRNRALDLLRRRGAAQRSTAVADVPEPPPAPDSEVAGGEAAAKIRNALAQLPDAQRNVLELAYFEGLTHVEIAERTKTPLGTVKTRILDGMRKLRTLLEDLR